jgi:hypothetical protein
MGPEKCPFCGQEIDAEATKCFFCGEELNEESVEKRLEELLSEDSKKSVLKSKNPPVLQLAVVVILICIALFSGTSKRKPTFNKAKFSSESTLRLNTKVVFTGTKFIISNNDKFDWTNVELQIVPETEGSNYSLKVGKIPTGEKYSVNAAEFASKEGSKFNPNEMKPKKIRIWCDTPTRVNGSYFAGWN